MGYFHSLTGHWYGDDDDFYSLKTKSVTLEILDKPSGKPVKTIELLNKHGVTNCWNCCINHSECTYEDIDEQDQYEYIQENNIDEQDQYEYTQENEKYEQELCIALQSLKKLNTDYKRTSYIIRMLLGIIIPVFITMIYLLMV